jgi:hypothetical protein
MDLRSVENIKNRGCEHFFSYLIDFKLGTIFQFRLQMHDLEAEHLIVVLKYMHHSGPKITARQH